MATTFTRINAVVVDESFSRRADAFLDPAWAAGTYAANQATDLNPLASSGGCYRGMPVALASATGKLVPISQVTVPASTSAARYYGVLAEDISAFVVARNGKVPVVHAGRVRSYAGGTLQTGDPVKPDITTGFNGFVKWVDGTDSVELRVGHAYSTLDGSDGNSPGVTMAQGDTIFVDLVLV